MTNSIKTLVDARTYAVRFIVALATMATLIVAGIGLPANKANASVYYQYHDARFPDGTALGVYANLIPKGETWKTMSYSSQYSNILATPDQTLVAVLGALNASDTNIGKSFISVFEKGSADDWSTAIESTKLISTTYNYTSISRVIAVSNDGSTIIGLGGDQVGQAIYIWQRPAGGWGSSATLNASAVYNANGWADFTAATYYGNTGVVVNQDGSKIAFYRKRVWSAQQDSGSVGILTRPAGGWKDLVSGSTPQVVVPPTPVNNCGFGNDMAYLYPDTGVEQLFVSEDCYMTKKNGVDYQGGFYLLDSSGTIISQPGLTDNRIVPVIPGQTPVTSLLPNQSAWQASDIASAGCSVVARGATLVVGTRWDCAHFLVYRYTNGAWNFSSPQLIVPNTYVLSGSQNAVKASLTTDQKTLGFMSTYGYASFMSLGNDGQYANMFGGNYVVTGAAPYGSVKLMNMYYGPTGDLRVMAGDTDAGLGLWKGVDAPTVPQNVSISGGTSSGGTPTITFNLSEPTNFGGGLLSGYEYSTDNGTTWELLTSLNYGDQAGSSCATYINYGSGDPCPYSPLTSVVMAKGKTVTLPSNFSNSAGTQNFNACQAYTTLVRAINTGGANGVPGVASSPITVYPGAPSAPSVYIQSRAAGSVTFSISTYSAYSANTITNVEYSLDGGTTWVTKSPAAANATITVSNLTDGQGYDIRARAVATGCGAGTPSAPSAATQFISGTPTAPQIQGSAALSGASIKITTAPVVPSGAPVTNYEYTTDAGTTWTALSPAQTTSPLSITGLTNGTSYNVAVRAVNKFGAGDASSAASVTPGTPGAPMVYSTVGGDGQATLNMLPPQSDGGSPITGYQYSLNGITWLTLSTTSPVPGQLQATITGLTNGAPTMIFVRAQNAYANSANFVTQVIAGVPGAPTITGVSWSNSSPTTASVTFTPGADNGSAITQYKYCVTQMGFCPMYTSTSPITTTSPISVPVTAGVTVTIMIVAVNARGQSSAAQTQFTPGGPSAPTITGASFSGDTTTVTFTPPTDPGISAIIGYDYQIYYPGQQSPPQWIPLTGQTTSPVTITGLNSGAAYLFLRARNASYAGAASNGFSLTVPAPPAPPVFTASTPSGTGTVGTAYTYTFAATASPDASFSVASGSLPVGLSLDATTGVLSGTPANDGTFTFTIQASNGNGSPATTSSITIVISRAAGYVSLKTTLGTLGVGTPVNVNVANTGTGTFAVTAGALPAGLSLDPATGQVTGTPAESGTYDFTITATGTSGTTYSQFTGEVVDAPAAPTGVTAIAGNGSATVSWTAPSNTSGIVSYTVTSNPGGFTCTVNAPATSCVVSGLTNGTSYTFSVTSNGAVATSAPSSPSASVAPTATAPDSPTNVTAVPFDGGATVSWTAPASDGGSPIDGYIVTASPGGATCTAIAPAATCQITGLTNGVAYTFSVVASNDAGTSDPSAPSSSVTPASTPGPAEYFQATPGNRTVTVNWQAPSTGPTITRYVVSSPGLTSCTVNVALNPSAPLQCTFNGLTNGQVYYFAIRAYAANGTSSVDIIWAIPSKTVTFPSSPRNVTFSGNQKGVATVTWQVSGSNGGSRVLKYVAIVIGPRFFKTCTVNIATRPTAKLQCQFTGLKIRRFYMYRVTAVTTAGTTYSARAKRAIAMDVRIATFARGKTTMWSGLARQAAITATFAKQFKFTKLVVTGYTNPGGSLASRTRFTQARALTVARFLTARLRAMGITNVQVVAAGAGKSLYNSRTLTTRQRQLNRSVVATLSYK